jgi:hypothetical protein
MPRWKKGEKKFTVGINFNKKRGYQSSIPKPVLDALEKKPDRVTFTVRKKSVGVTFSSKPKKKV